VANDAVLGGLGKLVLGGAVGFGLVYFFGTGLGLGGGGRGRADETKSKDENRLSFIMIEPKMFGKPSGFRLRDGDPAKIYSLNELIARVKDGGRTDVELRSSGAVIQGPWDEAKELIKRAGLTIWSAESSPSIPAHVVGFSQPNARGQYGRRSR